MISPEDEKQIQASLAAVTKMYREGVLPADAYYKSVVCLAFEFSKRGEHLRAAGILQGIPLEYFQKVQRPQMTEDPNYAYVGYSLALNLVQNGLVHMGPGVQPNVPSASA